MSYQPAFLSNLELCISILKISTFTFWMKFNSKFGSFFCLSMSFFKTFSKSLITFPVVLSITRIEKKFCRLFGLKWKMYEPCGFVQGSVCSSERSTGILYFFSTYSSIRCLSIAVKPSAIVCLHHFSSSGHEQLGTISFFLIDKDTS